MLGFDGAAYDRWLEAPYREAEAREAQFERFCNEQDVDPNASDAWERFDAWIEDQYDEPDYEPDYDDYDY